MRKLFFLLSIVCWAISFVFHLDALIFDYEISQQISFWLLHIGVCIVWVPTVLILRENKEFEELRRNNTLTNNIKHIKTILHRNPKWLVAIAFISCIYAILNFILAMILQNDSSEIHNTTRIFSGHWMAFYAIAAVTLFQYNQTEKSVEN